MVPPRPLPILLLLPALAAQALDEWSDPYFGITLKVAGIEAAVGRGDIAQVFDGRAAGGVRLTVRMVEEESAVDAVAMRAAVKAAWEKSKRKMERVSEGEGPQPWILLHETRLAVFEAKHLYAYFARGMQGFEVHAWLDDGEGKGDEALRAAVAGFSMAPGERGALLVRRIALEESKGTDDPKVLLLAGAEYARGAKYRRQNRPLAAKTLALARATMKEESYTPEELWWLFECGGSVQPTPNEAIEWFARAEQACERIPSENKQKERAAQSGYNLACSCSLAGDLDQAFAALDRAFTHVKPVTDAHVSGDKDLDNCRRDPRWEAFWRKRVKPG